MADSHFVLWQKVKIYPILTKVDKYGDNGKLCFKRIIFDWSLTNNHFVFWQKDLPRVNRYRQICWSGKTMFLKPIFFDWSSLYFMTKKTYPVFTKVDHDWMTNLLSATSFAVERLPWFLRVAIGRPNRKSNSSPDLPVDQLGDLSYGFRTENLYLKKLIKFWIEIKV